MVQNDILNKVAWIIDDDPIARLLIKKMLERTGSFKVFEEFYDGLDFITRIKEAPKAEISQPDLILLDINMPEKDGWDVLDFVTNENIKFDNCLLFVLTSSINPKDKIKARSYKNVSGFLNKPLKQDDVNNFNI